MRYLIGVGVVRVSATRLIMIDINSYRSSAFDISNQQSESELASESESAIRIRKSASNEQCYNITAGEIKSVGKYRVQSKVFNLRIYTVPRY